MPKPRVVHVRPEDETCTGPKLWAYGYRYIASRAGVDVQVGRAAANSIRGRDPEFDPSDPVAVVVWALEQRGATDLARMVREQFEADA